MSVPSQLKYSEALKPVSIPSSQQSRKFTPTSSGPYNTGNNIIRVPLNANAFIDTRNMVLKFALQQTAATTCYLDGSASSAIQRVEITSPDGQTLSNIDNYGRLYHALMDVERGQLNRESVGNLMEGCSTDNLKISLRKTGTAFESQILLNDNVIDTIVLGTPKSVRVGNFVFSATGVNTAFAISGIITFNNGAAIVGNTATLTLGSDMSVVVNGVSFQTRNANAGQLFVDGTAITLTGTAIGAQVFIADVYREHTALSQSEIFAQNSSKTYAVPLVCPISNIKTLYPAMLVGGQGCVLNIYLANSNDQVFFSALPATSPVYSITNVEVIAPVINYPDSVVQSLKSAVSQMGSLNMSAIDYQSFPYPYANAVSALSIPIAVRVRSLKSLIFFFQSNQSNADYSIPRTSAREFLNISQWSLKVGTQYFPASPVQFSATNPAESVVELYKGFSRLNDIQVGPYLSKDNFYLSQAFGGLSVYAIDLEALGFGDFLEAGLDTTQGAPQTYLEITLSANTPSAGTAYVYAMYDSTLSILANQNMTMSR